VVCRNEAVEGTFLISQIIRRLVLVYTKQLAGSAAMFMDETSVREPA
jgi:hypothetical protein